MCTQTHTHTYTHTCTHVHVHAQMRAHTHMLGYPDTSSMNAAFEFSGDRREVEVGMTDVERKVLEREETRLDLEQASKMETTLLSAGQPLKVGY